MSKQSLADLLKLSEAERIQLAQDLWDSIPVRSDALPLSAEQLEEMERRLAEHRTAPRTATPADEARAQLRDRFGV